jgi:hypothetical protein
MSRKFLTPIVLPADPAAALEAATKQYVDGLVVVSASDPIATNPNAELWVDSDEAGPNQPLPAGMPRGWIGQGLQSGSPAITTAESDVTGCTVTWTAEPTRRYRTTARFGLRQSAVAAEQYVFIVTAANAHINYGGTACSVIASGFFQHNIVLTETGLSGSTTRKLRAALSAGTATGGVGDYAGLILVEDIGGV